jgi:hypothetical protein
LKITPATSIAGLCADSMILLALASGCPPTVPDQAIGKLRAVLVAISPTKLLPRTLPMAA